MDTAWAFRQAYVCLPVFLNVTNHRSTDHCASYDKARQIKERQDAYCEKIESGDCFGLGNFQEDLQYEALVDVLRGRVKVNVHCCETVDLDDIIRVSYSLSIPHAIVHLDPM